jgi:hypothetical protein
MEEWPGGWKRYRGEEKGTLDKWKRQKGRWKEIQVMKGGANWTNRKS